MDNPPDEGPPLAPNGRAELRSRAEEVRARAEELRVCAETARAQGTMVPFMDAVVRYAIESYFEV